MHHQLLPRTNQPPPVTGDAALTEVRALERSFGARRAVAGVDFALAAGECLALFGPTGAGKTTLLHMIAGLLKPTRDHAAIAGVTLPAGIAARAMVGLISHTSMRYEALTPGGARGCSRSVRRGRRAAG